MFQINGGRLRLKDDCDAYKGSGQPYRYMQRFICTLWCMRMSVITLHSVYPLQLAGRPGAACSGCLKSLRAVAESLGGGVDVNR